MSAPEVVVIGGSAGGLKALRAILDSYGDVSDTVLVAVLHRSPQNSPLAEVLQAHTTIPVREPNDSPWDCPVGGLTLGPAGYHLLIGNSRELLPPSSSPVSPYRTGTGVRAHLTLDAPVRHSRPSLDVTFASAAELVNPVTAVLLSCANEDGARGCEVIKSVGGRVVLQDPASCEVPTAVDAALRRFTPDLVADPAEIGRWLSASANDFQPRPRRSDSLSEQ